MSFSDNMCDSDWKDTKMKVVNAIKEESNSLNTKMKYSQKFCDKWLKAFSPWLTRSDKDQNKPFCRACQCKLDCNRCHLQRHERTSKHQRNLEILINKGEVAARQNLTIRQERSKYYLQRKKTMSSSISTSNDDDNYAGDHKLNENVDEKTAHASKEIQLGKTETDGESGLQTHLKREFTNVECDERIKIRNTPKCAREDRFVKGRKSSSVNKEGLQLLMQIHKDKNELMESFKDLFATGSQQTTPAHKEKNHIDLFFESVSSSVKALSPKLISEAKMRVSQLICELELRSLTDDSIPGPKATTSVVVSSNSNNTTYLANQRQSEIDTHFDALS